MPHDPREEPEQQQEWDKYYAEREREEAGWEDREANWANLLERAELYGEGA